MQNEKMQRIAAAAKELEDALNQSGHMLKVDVDRIEMRALADKDSRCLFNITVKTIEGVYP